MLDSEDEMVKTDMSHPQEDKNKNLLKFLFFSVQFWDSMQSLSDARHMHTSFLWVTALDWVHVSPTNSYVEI